MRFLGIPVIGVRQHGERSDFPHLCGYSAAYKLLAPFPKILESPDVPQWIKEKTIYTPGFSRYCWQTLSKSAAREQLKISQQQKVVLVLNGKGGGKHSLTKIATAALLTPQWLWLIVGEISRDSHNLPHNVSVLGWREDTYTYLKAADVAIASGGHNTVMEIGTARVPFLCIPEPRPFDEQTVKAQLLEKLGLSLTANTFPDGKAIAKRGKEGAIGFILEKLTQLDVTKWEQVIAVDGAAQAARAIESEVEFLYNYQKSLDIVTDVT